MERRWKNPSRSVFGSLFLSFSRLPDIIDQLLDMCYLLNDFSFYVTDSSGNVSNHAKFRLTVKAKN